MKLSIIFNTTCLLLFLIPLSAFAQNNGTELHDGGEYIIENTQCVTAEQRNRIQIEIQKNRAQLNLSQDRQSALPALEWPLRKANGLDYNSYYGISNFVDHNAANPNQILDYNCGSRTYDVTGYNHAGIDIFTWPFSRFLMDNDHVEIIAAAAGIIIYKEDGNFDMNCDFSNPNWNAVYIEHNDGSVAWYGHMKKNSTTTKNVGQTVAVGEYLGVVGSSGNSTGPHLHFELYDASNTLVDPYFIPDSCNSTATASLWANQKPYYESTLNAIMTHSSPPVFNACPTPATRNISNCFEAGETVFMAAYFHDQLPGLSVSLQINRPNGAIFDSWTHTGGSNTFAASYWYWYNSNVANQEVGTWTFQATYQGVVLTHNFEVSNDCNYTPPPIITWTGNGANNNWHNTDNWDLNRLPTNEDDVRIGPNYTVIIQANRTAFAYILSLDLTSDLAVNSTAVLNVVTD